MTVDDMNMQMRMFRYECGLLADAKNRDYHPDNVSYLEILRTAWETGITVEQDLWGRVRKQLSALRNYVIDGKLASEPPRERMMDISNYMAILAVWDANKSQIIVDAISFVAGTPCELLGSARLTSLSCIQSDLPLTEICDRCNFLRWLNRQHIASVSPGSPSPLTPRPPV